MSGSLTLSSDPFTDAERTDIRRFCGYPAYGSTASGFSSWRFFQQYDELEFRMTNLAPAEFQVVRQYLANLYPLETGILGAAANLDTDKAAVWVHNKTEVTERAALFDGWRRRLCEFFGIPAGPGMSQSIEIII